MNRSHPVRDACPAERTQWLAAEVQPHEALLRRYLRHQFPTADIDEIVQESYLRMLQGGTAGRIHSAKAYFFSVARNLARKLFRRRQRFFSPIPVNELPEWRIVAGDANAAALADASDRLALVAKAIDQLPARCRAVLRLAAVQGLSTAEIARELGISNATVRVQMARGIARCSRFIAEKELT